MYSISNIILVLYTLSFLQVSRTKRKRNIGRKSKIAKNQSSCRKRRKAACPTTDNNEQQISECAVSARLSRNQESQHVNNIPQEIPPIIINKKREKLMRQFHLSISSFADIVCIVCKKLYYKKQVCNTTISDTVKEILPNELCELNVIITCFRCANLIKKGKVPTQAYWNAIFLDDIPEVIKNLSDMEQRLLSRIVPFVKIIKLGGRFGQSGFRGQAVLFAQDIEEISEQLPLPIARTGMVIVCEQLENVERCRQFQVNIQNLSAALSWLVQNNPLYRNVTINLDTANFDISGICQVIVTQ